MQLASQHLDQLKFASTEPRPRGRGMRNGGARNFHPTVLQRSPDLAVGECNTDLGVIDLTAALQRSPDLAVGEW